MRATVHILRQLDVGDIIQLGLAQRRLAQKEPSTARAEVGAAPAAPPGVVMRSPPVDVKLAGCEVGGFACEVRARLFDFGVVAFRFTLELAPDGTRALVDAGNRLARLSAEFDAHARQRWQTLATELGDAVTPWEEAAGPPLLEDFSVFVLPGVPDGEMDSDAAFAHLLLAEPCSQQLAASTVQDVARRTIRYYEDDRVLVDFDTAVLVDRDGASELVDIFEIASSQLLELRFYDAMLERSLKNLLRDVRRARTTAWLFRSPFQQLARRGAVLALELAEMTDRLERAITLVRDTYSTQVYREAALRFRLSEASSAVREKLGMIGRVSEALGHEVDARRDLVLEILVILLILLEVLIAFRQ